jgi:hypothetical protein
MSPSQRENKNETFIVEATCISSQFLGKITGSDCFYLPLSSASQINGRVREM